MKLFISLLFFITVSFGTFAQKILNYESVVIITHIDSLNYYHADSLNYTCGQFKITDNEIIHYGQEDSSAVVIDRKIWDSKCNCFYYYAYLKIDEYEKYVIRVNEAEHTVYVCNVADNAVLYVYFLTKP